MNPSPKGSTVYLIPSLLHENAIHTLPAYILDAVKDCQVFFVENERSARRFLKSIWREMIIDEYEWVTIHKAEKEVKKQFTDRIREGKNIGIVSEAGCPGVADPGQLLVSAAHKMGAVIKPLAGPSSILLAVMGSGLNGQQFRFFGYLPIESTDRIKTIKQIENDSLKNNSTQIFIETPYRNNQLLDTIIRNCQPETLLCIAADLTSENEMIRTKKIIDWKKELPDLHKRPTVFCLLAI